MNIMPKPNSNFTVIQNDIFNNYPDMSAKSKFMLLQVLSKPADWKLNLSWLAKQNNEGIHAVRSAVQEWEGKGFLHRFTIRVNGRIKEVEPVVCYPPLIREEAEAHFKKAYPEIRERDQWPNCQRELPLEFAQDANDEIHPSSPPAWVDPGEPVAHHATPSADATKICDQETCHQVFNTKETAPILNTDIKQIVRETTTTTPSPEPITCDPAVPLPSSCSAKDILHLIPEKHRSPMVISLVNKAIVDYPANEIEEAIAYAACNVRGGSMQFKAYLDKTLKNRWAAGYLESMQAQNALETPWSPPRDRFPNGFTTGSRRMDANLAACLEFAAYGMGKAVTA